MSDVGARLPRLYRPKRFESRRWDRDGRRVRAMGRVEDQLKAAMQRRAAKMIRFQPTALGDNRKLTAERSGTSFVSLR